QIVVKTDYPIKNVLRKPDLAGRMVAWSVELFEFDITYVPRGAIKSQNKRFATSRLATQGDIEAGENGSSGDRRRQAATNLA
ncbi:hypothetical protein A2U01_0047448, partial [Trifolium medium]|nr:hypothetical protein [Trifolium medium]